MSARVSTFASLAPVSVRAVWIRIRRGEVRLGRRRVELTPAQIFANVPPRLPRPRALALMQGNPCWLTCLSLARPLVLQRSSAEGGYTIVAGLETWCVARAVSSRTTPVLLYGCVVTTPHKDAESLAALLLALSTGTTTRTPRGAIARRTRALLGQVLGEGQQLLVADVCDLHGVSRQALWSVDRKQGLMDEWWNRAIPTGSRG